MEENTNMSDEKVCLVVNLSIKPAREGTKEILSYEFKSEDGSIVKNFDYSYNRLGIYHCNDSGPEDYVEGLDHFKLSNPRCLQFEEVRLIKTVIYMLHYVTAVAAIERDEKGRDKYTIKVGHMGDELTDYIKLIVRDITDDWVDQIIRKSEERISKL